MYSISCSMVVIYYLSFSIISILGDQLPLSQQPSNDDEDSGQKSSQAINDTAPGENELVVPGERVVRQLSYGS